MEEISGMNGELTAERSALKKKKREPMPAGSKGRKSGSLREASLIKLRKSEERYRQLTESAHDLILSMDLDGVIRYANRAAIDLAAPFSLIDLPMQDITPPNLLQRHRDLLQKRRAGDDSIFSYEWELTAQDGNRRLIMDVTSSLLTEDGEPSGILVVARDVTDRKLREEELRESEERYRAISENSHNAICIVDEQGKITWGNKELQVMSGYSLTELFGAESFASFIAPESTEFVFANYQKFLADAPYEHHYEFYFLRHDGEKRLCEKRMMDFKDKHGKRNLIINMMDISNRRKADDMIRHQTDAMEAAIDGMALLNTEGKFFYLNKAHVSVYGYDNAGELIGKSWKVLYEADEVKRFEEEIMPVFARKGEWHGEAIGRKKNGDKFPQEVSLTGLDSGGLICIVRDIANHKLLESQLIQAQKMEAMGTLAGGIAHDFNNILGSMIGYTELAMEETDQSERHQELEQVLRSCDRAKDLVKQILTFSRKSDVEKKPIAIKPLLKESIQLLRAATPTTIEIVHSIASPPMTALVNPTQIHQVIMNICTNAIHAMRETGGILEINLTTLDITPKLPLHNPDLQPGPYLKLEIRDTGRGIDPVIMNRIFDPFFTTKGASEGTGLGLSVVYGIVKSHNGDITVQSKPGSGSIFTVYLPRITNKEATETENHEVIPRGHEHVLIVDDEEALVTLGRNMLRKFGYKVSEVTDSVQALKMFKDNPDAYDLVITDMTMPHMNGLELTGAILAIRSETPIILCTGHSELLNEERAVNTGVKRLLFKPLGFRELARAVREVLDKRNNVTLR
ncbi:MAG: PAS domain S-box protein [Syntrophales bacterium]